MSQQQSKPYPAYKPSGIEWLGEIPTHWEMKRLKYMGTALIGLTYDPSEITEEGEGTLVLRSSNVQGGQIVFDDNVYVNKEIPERLITKEGDILICSRNGSRALIGKNAKIGGKAVGLTFGAFMTVFRSKYSSFLHYVLNSSIFEFQSSAFLTATINQLTVGNLSSFEVPVPPPQEQQLIAEFLCQETAKIDELMAEQRWLIDLLKEKRQAVISHAVTKGLNPDAAMKDSGIEWLGEVPAHWKISKLGYESWIRARLGWKGLKADEYVDDGFVFLATPNIKGKVIDFEQVNYINQARYDESPEIKLTIGDVLLAKDGSTLGTVNIVRQLPRPATVNSSIAVITPDNSLKGNFLYYLFQSNYLINTIQMIKGGMGVPHLFQEDLNRFSIPLPPVSEQEKITDFLDTEVENFDNLTAQAEWAVELLQERRTALISAAVTGKIDVRSAVREAALV